MDAVIHIRVVAPVYVYGKAFDEPLVPEDVKFRGVAGQDFFERRRPRGRMGRGVSGEAGWFHGETTVCVDRS
jgi:hypothetical protein